MKAPMEKTHSKTNTDLQLHGTQMGQVVLDDQSPMRIMLLNTGNEFSINLSCKRVSLVMC